MLSSRPASGAATVVWCGRRHLSMAMAGTFHGHLPMQITTQQVEGFTHDRFAIIEGLLDDSRIQRLHAAMDRVYAGIYNVDRRPPRLCKPVPVTPFGDASSVHWILNARVLDDELWGLATDPGVGEVAARLLGTPRSRSSRIRCWTSPPAAGRSTSTRTTPTGRSRERPRCAPRGSLVWT